MAVRWLSAALIFLVGASISFVVLWLVWFYFSAVVGGTECDRGTCPAFGEWVSENTGLILGVLATLSILSGVWLTKRVLRRDS
jgi:hypothetical protein